MKYICFKPYENFKRFDIIDTDRININELILKEYFKELKLDGFRFAPYSFSKIDTYHFCPKKFEYNYIIKPDIEKEPNEILEKGTLFHSFLEYAIVDKLDKFKLNESEYKALDSKKIDEVIIKVEKFLKSKLYKKIKRLKGEKFTEYEFFLNKKLKPTLKEEKALIRGFIDLLIYDEEERIAYIFDWKTGGKSKENLIRFPKPNRQLKLYSLWALQALDIDEVLTGFVYVEQDHIAQYEFFKEDLSQLKEEFTNLIESIEETEIFIKKESVLCDWCDFKSLCKGEEIAEQLFEQNDSKSIEEIRNNFIQKIQKATEKM